jgi:hypothetical protein
MDLVELAPGVRPAGSFVNTIAVQMMKPGVRVRL